MCTLIQIVTAERTPRILGQPLPHTLEAKGVVARQYAEARARPLIRQADWARLRQRLLLSLATRLFVRFSIPALFVRFAIPTLFTCRTPASPAPHSPPAYEA